MRLVHSLLLILALAAGAAQAGDFSDEQARALMKYQERIRCVQELTARGLMSSTERDRALEMYRNEASRVAGRDVTVYDLLALAKPKPYELSPLQKLAGLIDAIDFTWTLSVLLIAGSVLYLAWGWIESTLKLLGRLVDLLPIERIKKLLVRLIDLLFEVPVVVWEVLLFALCAALIWAGTLLNPEIGVFLGLTGCLLLMGVLAVVKRNHFPNKPHDHFRFSAFLFVAWAPVAVLYGSGLIGFFAVLAMMNAVGFMAAMRPGAVIIDVSIDQGGCVETSRPTTLRDPTFVKHGVAHYCVPNFTALVARTASRALSNVVRPYLPRLADDPSAIFEDPLRSAVVVYEGKFVNQQIAATHQREAATLEDLR